MLWERRVHFGGSRAWRLHYVRLVNLHFRHISAATFAVWQPQLPSCGVLCATTAQNDVHEEFCAASAAMQTYPTSRQHPQGLPAGCWVLCAVSAVPVPQNNSFYVLYVVSYCGSIWRTTLLSVGVVQLHTRLVYIESSSTSIDSTAVVVQT